MPAEANAPSGDIFSKAVTPTLGDLIEEKKANSDELGDLLKQNRVN